MSSLASDNEIEVVQVKLASLGLQLHYQDCMALQTTTTS